jgi:prophage maintenance system killer protein
MMLKLKFRKSTPRWAFKGHQGLLYSRYNVSGIAHQKSYSGYTVFPGIAILCVCVLENHAFLGTGIDQKISPRHVFIDDAQLRTSFSCATPNSFFIGAHGQELSVPRNSTLIRMPHRNGDR